MAVSEADAKVIVGYFNKKLGRIPSFLRPNIKKAAAEIPECARKYTLGEIIDLLVANFR